MKKIKAILITFLLGLGTLLAQTPGAFNYQAVLRDAEGKIISNQDVSIQISILQQSASGELVFQEKHSASTNEFGLIVLEIGNGIPLTGTLAEISWGEGTHFLKVELDATGGESYTEMGTSQMLSVPYALYAKSSGSGFSGKYADLEGTPELPNDISDLSDAGNLLFDGDYNSLTNKPDLSQLSSEDTNGWDKDVSDDFDGDYNNLTNKPTTITAAQASAIEANTAKVTNVNADWNAATGEAQILNKPDLTVYIEESNTSNWDKNANDDFDGDYNHLTNKPTTISAAQASDIEANTAKISNVNADWNVATGEAQILNKPDLTIYVEETNTSGWDKDASDDFDGDYAKLTNKPTTISVAQASAIDANTAKISNVKADWNAASGEAQILNKPDLTVYLEESNTSAWDKNTSDDFSGSFNDLTDVPANLDTDATDDFDGDYNSLINKPATISAAQATAIDANTAKISNVKADWNAASGESQILNKPDLTVYVETANTSAWDKDASDDFSGSFNELTDLPANLDTDDTDDFDGDYNSLINKPATISATQATAIDANTAKISNVKADWNAATGEAQILNKPDLTVYVEESNTSGWDKDASDDFSGSFNELTDLPANLDTDDTDDFDGDYNSLINKPIQDIIHDADSDTKIQVEKNADEDIIRYDIAGTEKMTLTAYTLEFKNNGKNVVIGEEAGKSITDGTLIYDNTFIGYKSGYNSSTDGFMSSAYRNTFIGSQSGMNNTYGYDNVALGSMALQNGTSGSNNVAIGPAAMLENKTGSNNVAIGMQASNYNTSGEYNVAIGYQAGYGQSGTNQTGNIMIGNRAGFSETGSNKLYIENSNSTTPLIYGEFDNNLLRVNGTLDINNAYQLPTTDGTAGQHLTTDGAGTTQWTDAPDPFDGDYNSLSNQPDLTNLHNHSGTGENSFIGGGIENTAAGLLATATGGQKNTASGYYSTIAGGYYNTAAYAANVGGGTTNKALGFHSTVVGGQGNTAWSYGETVIGFYSPYYAAESISEYKANDRLFVVANGTGDGARSNALVMLKNGNTTLNGQLTINNGTGTAYTLPADNGTDGQVLTTDGAGNTSWISSSSHDHSGNEYDNSFIGVNNSNVATGGYSAVVAGSNNTSSGNSSAILGGSVNTASGVMATIVTGFNNKALSEGSFVANGINNLAVGNSSVVIGAHSNSAQSYGEMVLGMFNDTLETVNSRTSYNANDRLLVIGNGSGPARSNALVMLKNGNTTLNGDLTVNGNITSEKTYTVGLNTDLGGYVIYVTPNGKHGLVAATQDQSTSATWYEAQDAISDPSNHDSAGQNFTDWRLPTKYELNIIHTYRTELNASLGQFTRYWSSTESDPDYAYNQGFNDGTIDQGAGTKTVTNYVRAIRSF